jgi:hypothetical protein
MEEEKLELLFLISEYLAINNDDCLKAVRIYLENKNIEWSDAVKYLNLNGFSEEDMIVSKEERQYYRDGLQSFIEYA